jgi:hypothetical protein
MRGVDLTSIPTCDLVAELRKREGVESEVIGIDDDSCEMVVNGCWSQYEGPMIILRVID